MKSITFFTFLLTLIVFSCTNPTTTEEPLQDIKQESEKGDSTAKSIPKHLESFSLAEWPEHVKGGNGCSCDFQLEKNNYKAMVFVSDIETKACFKLDGKMELLTRNNNHIKPFIEQSEMPNWIVLNEKGDDLLFGQKINYDGDWQEEVKQILKKILFVLDELPEEIPMKSIGTVGMGHRSTFRDICSDALTEVKIAKESGIAIPYFVQYGNDKYECIIEAEEIGKNDGGGSKYEGHLIIKGKDGINIVKETKVWGVCGC